MSYGNGIKLTAGFDVGAKTPLDSKSVVQTIAERDAFVTDNLVYEGLEVYVKDTGHKYRYNGTSWIDLDTQSGSESGTGEGLTTEQANQLTTAYEHSQTPHVSVDDIPTNISDLTNDSGFITSIPSEYITETELETKGYLTEHQSLTDYAKKTDIPDVSDFLTEVPAGYVTDTKLSTELDKKVNKEAGKGLSTNDLTNELVIKINSSATEAFVTNAIANAQLGSGEVDLSGYATIDALKLKADLTHTHDQYLTKVPDEYITETELTDKNYADKTYVTQAVSNVKVDLTGYAKTSDIPTKTSDLNNDSGFIDNTDIIIVNKGDNTTEVSIDNDIPSGSSTILLTGRIVSDLYDKQLVTVSKSGTAMTVWDTKGSKVVFNKSNGSWARSSSATHIYNNDASAIYQKITDNTLTTTAKTIPTAINELKSGLNGIKVPTKTSELTNNSGFITTIPAEYITETELNAKGYLTSHQDISGLQTKTDKNLTTTSKEVVGAINELKTGVSSISVPTKVSQLTNDSGYLSTEDITTTINSTSADTQIPTAKAVNVAIKGKLITQEDIDTYGKEIIKFPVGKWVIGSVAISNLTDLPNSYVRYIEIMGISEVTNPWTNNNTLRSYKATSYKGDTFLRSLNSGNEAGVIASDTGWQRVLLNGDIIDNLTSTDTNKLLSANQGKILNDTKLNKTDANKLKCVTIENVSLKEYILTNFIETGKTYYLIAKTTCTDLPKASNFYITVETPGMYTYKVTAKELNDSNGIYVCTYRTISSSWTKWEKVCTTTVADVPETPIEFDKTSLVLTMSDNLSSYKVINGICYVTIELHVDAPSDDMTYRYAKINTTSLPKIGFGIKAVLNVVEANSSISVALDKGSTDIKLHGNVLAKEGTYVILGSFSYPVAES